MSMISSHAELRKMVMQEDCSPKFCVTLAAWKSYIDGRCVKSICVALCFTSDTLS